MKNSCFLITLLAILSSITITQSLSRRFPNSITDQHALIAFKNSITSDPHDTLVKNWSTNTSICHWIGVSCSIKHHDRVTALNISGFSLSGTILPHLGNLTFLQSLDISSNNFTGLLPYELSFLRRLKEMNVGINSLTGEIPPWLGTLSNLRHLLLHNNTFSGTIPPSLFENISDLRSLNMGYNFLHGNIPQEIGNLSFMETVNLQGNRFTGRLPYGVFNVSTMIDINFRYNDLSDRLPSDNMCENTPRLKRIYLSKNGFYGQIPMNIYKCGELEELRFADNHFSGSIPSEMGNTTMLRILYLWSNELKGELPQELGNLANLEILAMNNNSLSGLIPPSIFNISTLRVLDLSLNQFSGSLPSNMGQLSNLNLETIYLGSNKLIGEIPFSITNVSQLTVLSISSNSLSGSIPHNIGDLRLLQRLGIWGNKLTTTQDMSFLSSLTHCQDLEALQVSGNPLSGILPHSIGNLSKSLQSFWASGCSITGVIPSEIGNLSNLLSLDLSENEFTWFIPPTIGKLNGLQVMYLDGSRLQGYIPFDLCLMSSLGELYLDDNVLSGPIPECLGEVKSLVILNLASNKLNSSIPFSLWDLTDLSILNLSSNFLSGQLSPQISGLKSLNLVDLSSNRFSGVIPNSIDGCQSLEVLTLSNNKFEGSISQSFGNIRGLSTLDLSNNSISGLIPRSLQGLRFLEYFNVSYNKLGGEIPSSGPFVNFTAQSFFRNFALCGEARFQVSPCNEHNNNIRKTRPSKYVVRFMKYIIPPVISVIILAIVVLILIRRRKQRIITTTPTYISVGNAYRRISYTEIVRGTGGFSEANQLGRGSFGTVYKGTLSHDGLHVAVKVFNLQLEGAIKSFDTECEILSTIRHRNLVRVIGCCTNMEFKALILAYMPNGSLEKWLYSDSYHSDLLETLTIAIDVALALEYLHHGHTFPVVHCDIKPSNVLLDEDMTAHLGDFGISKLFDEGEVVVQTKTLATIGYAAPEYGSEGKVSTNGDVYSFGIMLLEMFTRKKPTDDMFSDEMSLKDWVSEALQENAASKISAPGLLSSREDQHFSEKEQCVSGIFGLAMECLKFSPDERINMMEMVAALKKIRAKFLSSSSSSSSTTRHH